MIELFVNHGSYLGIVVFLVLTGCGLPIPEEVAIVAAGILSAQELLDPWLALSACLVGALLGDSVMYAIGYHWGHGLLKAHPRFAHLLHAEREEKFEQMIQRHGLKVLFVARFMVGVRSPVYLASGVLRIPYRRFLLMDLFCATVVVSLFFGVSYLFGNQVVELVRQAELMLTGVVLLAVAIVALILYRRRNANRDSVASVSLANVPRAKPRKETPAG